MKSLRREKTQLSAKELELGMAAKHSVEFWKIFYHSEFSWNHFWHILSLKRLWNFSFQSQYVAPKLISRNFWISTLCTEASFYMNPFTLCSAHCMMISEKKEAPFSSSLSHKMPPMLDLRFGQERPLWRKRHDPNGSGEIVLVCRVDFHTVPFLLFL